MVTKPVVNSMLVLRIVTLATSVATMALLVTNNVTFDEGGKLKYQDYTSYSYMVAITAAACAYCVVQLPFAIYYAVQQRRLIRNGFLAEFDFYGDKITSLLLATGIGAGFALSVELKKFIDDAADAAGASEDDPIRSTYDKFFIRGIVASAFLVLAFISMTIVSFISSINRSKNN
ncbi:CASP-like protein 4D2 [Abrus precatorius]|uniref:CASP-like protein n=1 Tax=Abrus precatorius TaxID=3816 RepID=A0A8B8LM62_ABRPR|nr:CASP-like protein 4D2 [Abrus precatorius]